MKKILAVAFFVFLLSSYSKAQDRKMIGFQLSFNQVELGFEHEILNEKLFAAFYAGMANQDINSNFDDLTGRFGLGYSVFSNPKNQVSMYSGLGFYFTNNDYYPMVVPLVYAGTCYARLLGKTDKHRLLVSAGFRYGKRDYRQQYSSDFFNVTTPGTLKLPPLYFSVGYGFNF